MFCKRQSLVFKRAYLHSKLSLLVRCSGKLIHAGLVSTFLIFVILFISSEEPVSLHVKLVETCVQPILLLLQLICLSPCCRKLTGHISFGSIQLAPQRVVSLLCGRPLILALYSSLAFLLGNLTKTLNLFSKSRVGLFSLFDILSILNLTLFLTLIVTATRQKTTLNEINILFQCIDRAPMVPFVLL